MHIIFTLNANDFIEIFICFITSASNDLILRIKKPKKYGYNVIYYILLCFDSRQDSSKTLYKEINFIYKIIKTI